MTCPSCQRDNAANRRYCGGCGTNLEPVCRECAFTNETRDRFCGGCGLQLARGRAPVAATSPAPAPVAAAVAAPTPATPSGELDGLFANSGPIVEAPRLPDANISQDDLDRLFGASA